MPMRAWGELHEDVDVAVVAGLVARHGAEDRQPLRTHVAQLLPMFGKDPKDVVALHARTSLWRHCRTPLAGGQQPPTYRSTTDVSTRRQGIRLERPAGVPSPPASRDRRGWCPKKMPTAQSRRGTRPAPGGRWRTRRRCSRWRRRAHPRGALRAVPRSRRRRDASAPRGRPPSSRSSVLARSTVRPWGACGNRSGCCRRRHHAVRVASRLRAIIGDVGTRGGIQRNTDYPGREEAPCMS